MRAAARETWPARALASVDAALRLSWQQTQPQRRRILLAIGVIALSVALASAMLLANHALRDSFASSLDAFTGRAHLQVRAASGGSFDEQVIERIEDVPGVTGAAPILIGSAFLAGGGDAAVRVVGVDMLDDLTVRLYRTAGAPGGGLEDPLLFLSQPDSALVAASFARRAGLDVGSRLDLQTPAGPGSVTIRGLLAEAGVATAFDGRLLVLDLESAQRLLGEGARVTQIDVVIDEQHALDDVLAAIRARVPAHLEVERVADRKARSLRAVAGFQLMLDALGALALVLAALIVSNRLSTVYEARVWEIGVMRALGMPPNALFRGLLAEAAALSVVGALIGLPLGWALAQLIVTPLADSMALNFKQTVDAPYVALRAAPLVIAALAGVASGVLAALVPARRATRLDVVAVLAHGRRRQVPTELGGSARRLRWIVPLLAIAALAAQVATGDGWLGFPALILLAIGGGLLVQPALRALGAPIGWVFGGAAAIGVEDQSLVPGRATAAGRVLLGGIALVVWIGSVGRSFEHFVVGALMSTRQGDLVIDSAHSEHAVGASQTRIPDRVLREVERMPGVQAVGAVTYELSDRAALGIYAVDPIRFAEPRFGEWVLDGAPAADAIGRVARGEAVLGNTQLVGRLGLRVGDPVRIDTPSGVLEVPLAGVVTTSFLSQDGDVVMSRDLYRRHWRQDAFSEAQILLAAGADANRVERDVTALVGERYHVRVRSSQQLASWFADSVRKGFAVTDAMVLITLLVVLIGTADALAANVLERTREIGTMRALGMSRADVARMILTQALAIGAVGSALGVAVGLGMSLSFVEGVLRLVLGWEVRLYPTIDVAVLAGVLGVVACLAGAAVPAIGAARMSALRALRYE